MAMGMSYNEFWEAPPQLAVAYREAYKLKRMAENELAWLHGMYVFDAVAVVVSNALSKPGQTKKSYIDKPVDIFQPSEREKKRRERLEYQKMDAQLQAIRDRQQREKLKRGD